MQSGNVAGIALAAMLAMGEQRRKIDAENMRLGELIERLEKIPPDRTVITLAGTSVGGFDSYRGYYSDLALNPETDGWITVGDLLTKAREANGKTFTGYKGGDYRMDAATPVWLASYGNTGGIALAGVEERDYYAILIGLPTSDC